MADAGRKDGTAEAMMPALEAALRGVRDPASGRDLIAAGLVDSLGGEDGTVHLALRAERATQARMEALRAEAEAALGRVAGVRRIVAVLTAHRAPATSGAAPTAAAPQAGGPGARPKLLGEVAHVVAVASGKGGVGKSTLAVNLAVSLAARGLAVGLLDADIYGPSLPQMLGVHGRPEVSAGRMQPIRAWGLSALSIGNMVDPEAAMIWRGPMIMGALEQMLGQADWGALDVMVVDMPPGTGDVQLTLAQRTRLAGAVIVSTPQDVALADARRGVAMFAKVEVPVLGLVENMSMFCCPNCNHETALFGHGGVRAEAARMGVPFLGEIPLLLAIRETADAGTPVVVSAPDSPAAAAFRAVADGVAARLGLGLDRAGAGG